MRSAQVYRWQIPMDAGVVLRDRRLKTRDGVDGCLGGGGRGGWGGVSFTHLALATEKGM
ncbi:O-succinylbenzoate-CoA synthase [Salmonella enterica]|nr:O-succinylbenzoate-CoA synthase [Salmonella enterica]